MSRVLWIMLFTLALPVFADTHVIPQGAFRDFVNLYYYVSQFKSGDVVRVGKLVYVLGEYVDHGTFGTVFKLVSVNGTKSQKPEVIKFSTSKVLLSYMSAPADDGAIALEKQVATLEYLKGKNFNTVNINKDNSVSGVTLVMDWAEGISAKSVNHGTLVSNHELVSAWIDLGKIAAQVSELDPIPRDINVDNIKYNTALKKWIIFDPGNLEKSGIRVDALNQELVTHLDKDSYFWTELGRTASDTERTELLKFVNLEKQSLADCQNVLIEKLINYRPQLLVKMVRKNNQMSIDPKSLGEKWVNLQSGLINDFSDNYWTVERVETAFRLRLISENDQKTVSQLLDHAVSKAKSKQELMDLFSGVQKYQHTNVADWLVQSKNKSALAKFGYWEGEFMQMERAFGVPQTRSTNEIQLDPVRPEQRGFIQCIRNRFGI